ncbi:MAG: glycosyltransferase family 61 protein [Pirellulales bacterium]
MPFSSAHFTRANRLVRRLLVGRRSYQDVATKRWELSPAEATSTPPAIHLDGELDRVIEVQSETSFLFEAERLQGGVRQHSPTAVYLLEKTSLDGGAVYKGAMKHRLCEARPVHDAPTKLEYFPEATMTTTWCSAQYFGHWLVDEQSAALAARQLAPAVTVRRPMTPHQSQYSEVFDLACRPVSRARFDRLLILDDVGQNRFKRERYQSMRQRVASLGTSPPPRGVWFWRGTTGAQRAPLNEPQVADLLARRGFAILEADKMSVDQIAKAAVGARIVAGIEGSHLFHGVFTIAEGGTFLVLQPPRRFNNLIKDYADCLGLRYALMVGDDHGDGYSFDLVRLARTLDLIEPQLS